RELCARGCALYAVATLSRAPEKPRYARVESDYRIAVRGKGTQSRPARSDATDLDVEGALDALDGRGDHQIVRVHITGREWLLFRRGDQQPCGVGFEVELLIDIENCRPGVDRYALWSVDERCGTTQRSQSEWRCSAGDGELIGPRARGVDEHGRSERLTVQ